MSLDPYQTCLAFIRQGLDLLDQRDFEKADRVFRLVEKMTESLLNEQAQSISALRLSSACLLSQRENHADEAMRLRLRAMTLVDAIAAALQTVLFSLTLARVLVSLQEYRRAIPFYEEVLRSEIEKQPLGIAEILERVGYCYAKCGLKEHAAIPLRAALKIFRDYPGDPRLASALLTLGNALRKISPAESEELYREAAEIHEAKAQLVSATPAWGKIWHSFVPSKGVSRNPLFISKRYCAFANSLPV